MISVLLVDDEIPALEELEYFLSSYRDVSIWGMYTNPIEALKFMETKKPDVVFLDIDMPGINGMEFAVKIQDIAIQTEIVFVTAHHEFSLQAFDVHAVDYILKPIVRERFKKTMARLMEQCTIKRELHKTTESIFIKCFGKFEIIKNGQTKEILKWRTNKTKELFLYLLYKHEKTCTKNELITVLFHGIEEKKAHNNLYVTMYYLRKNLEDFGVDRSILLLKEDYSLEVYDGTCDYIELLRFLHKNLTLDEDNIDRCHQVIESYKGCFLEEEDYSWAYEIREYLDRKYEELLVLMADYYQKKNKMNKAENILRRLLRYNPLTEEGCRMLLELYMNTHNTEAFIKLYQAYEKTMKDELGLMPEKKYHDYYLMSQEIK
ncbi:response regulator [Candidatus Formimonas warabiya]|uniref:Stage 0 sporulation protein A homolog n=1 Tax=Formimonas warabiya TaxID=1761012 RepID=A0A3G1KSY6_FORW1|nr:response regulator [Candidatus Formimonas warabiya]ATW25537.1 hypothetical protein DCMF_12885 [Candidatus Formimonas warabiya]